MAEVYFTKENFHWLEALTDEALTKTTDKVKLLKLGSIKNKLEKLKETDIDVNISEEDIKEASAVLDRLETIVKDYTEQKGIAGADKYDELKKQMAGELHYLGSLKDTFMDELTYTEDVFKKEIRIRIVDEIKDDSGVSFSQADKLVEKDVRYVNMRKKVHKLRRLANNIKTKYDYYLKVWNMVFQSVSTAIKERHSDNNN